MGFDRYPNRKTPGNEAIALSRAFLIKECKVRLLDQAKRENRATSEAGLCVYCTSDMDGCPLSTGCCILPRCFFARLALQNTTMALTTSAQKTN